MNTEMIPFQFNSHKIRVLPQEDGIGIWVVAQDVADVLGYSRARNAVRHVPAHHKGARSVSSPGGSQDMLCIDEPGLYRLVLRSDKPQAEPFIEWVTAEVLPAIRRTGAYRAASTPAVDVTGLTAEVGRLTEENTALKEKLLHIQERYIEQIEKPQRKRPANRPISDSEVAIIRAMAAEGHSNRVIAERIGRSSAAVSYVRRGAMH